MASLGLVREPPMLRPPSLSPRPGPTRVRSRGSYPGVIPAAREVPRMTVLHASHAGSLAGLGSGRGMHILLVFAAAAVGVFVPAFLLADRWPRWA